MQALPMNSQPQSTDSIYSIKLDIFEGPLDLLLHLIQKDEMDVRDIRIAEITERYLEWLNLMEQLDLDVASEFLVMAATLLYLKSQSILPSATDQDALPIKNREELVKQLLDYKQFKEASQVLDRYAEEHEHVFGRSVDSGEELGDLREFEIKATLFDLLSAFQRTTERLQFDEDDAYEEINEEQITVEEKMEFLERRMEESEQVPFEDLFSRYATKVEQIVTFLAILELIRLKRIIAIQSGQFGQIYIVRREG